MPDALSPSSSSPASAPVRYRFGPFELDVSERRLLREGVPVVLQSRYFDLLVCLVEHAGTLVRKDTLFEVVWPGVVVGDAALTQGIRAIRRALDDDATSPQYIETVAGHGYRFIGQVEGGGENGQRRAERGEEETGVVSALPSPVAPPSAFPTSPLGAILGALVASLAGGTLYGAALGAVGPHPGSTTFSVAAMAMGAGGLGALAVAFGAAFGSRTRGGWGALVGGSLAGGLVGLLGEFAGRSVLVTLTQRNVGDITGGVEGLAIGAALGFAFAFRTRPARAIVATAASAMVVFALLAALGRPLFLGSLEETLSLPGVPFRLTLLAPGGPTEGLRVLLSALEGLLFGLGFAFGARRDG
ncbi:MAG TPA: transcriptional regulator [Rhodothermales bacterium]|nr:transcriptional regulator [Rhodothermales bacterium]